MATASPKANPNFYIEKFRMQKKKEKIILTVSSIDPTSSIYRDIKIQPNTWIKVSDVVRISALYVNW